MTTTPCVIVYIDLVPLRDTGTAQSVDKAVAWLERTLMPASLAEEYEFAFHRLGDSVVWLLPLNSPANLRHASGHLFHALLRVVQTQDGILAHGAMCHGVVKLGAVDVSNRGLSGPGIRQSQRLLSFWRSYPRVVVDPNLLRQVHRQPLLRAQHHAVADELGYIQGLLKVDSDGAWFVDYLRAVQSDVDEPEDYVEVLTRHQHMIRQELTAAVGDGSVQNADDYLRAMLWLATYHNRTVREIDPSLLVTSVPMLYEFP